MRVFIMILLFLTYEFSSAQTGLIDSLTLLLQKDIPDTNKVNHLLALSYEYEFENREKSQKFAFDALALARELKYTKGEAKSLTYLGYLEQDIGNLNNAIEYHSEVLIFSEKNNFKLGIALAIGNIGAIYQEQCNYPQALSYYFKSLKLDEELGDKSSISTDYGNIGLVYYEQGDFEKAKEYYLKAYSIDEGLGDKDGMARHIGNLASLYHQQDQFIKALQLYFNALKINEQTNNNNQVSAMLGNIGEAYQDLAKLEKLNSTKRDSLFNISLDYHLRALKMKKKLEDKRGMSINNGNIGSVLMFQKKYKEAEVYLKEALVLTKEIGAIDVLSLTEGLLSDLYIETNNYELSLEHYKQFTLLKDSIYNGEKEKELTRHEMNYEFEKKENAAKAEQSKKEAVARSDKKRQNILFWLISFVALSIGIIAVVVFRSLWLTRKQKQIIEYQKELVVEKQKEIIDSIYYAKRIQQSMLPTEKYIDKNFIRLKKF